MSPRRKRTRDQIVRIEVGPRNTSYIHGVGVFAVLDEMGVPHMFCPFRKVRCVPTNRLDDVLAFLEYRKNCVIALTAVD